jgi:hypothetical protein
MKRSFIEFIKANGKIVGTRIYESEFIPFQTCVEENGILEIADIPFNINEYYVDGIPGTAAVGTITLSGISIEDETFHINGQVFIWKALRTQKGEVTIGANPAVGTIIMSGVAIEDETFQIGDVVFTWKASRSGFEEVTIGTTKEEAAANIAAAIALDLATTVEAVDNEDGTVTVTAVLWGPDGNSIIFTESSTNMSMDGSGYLGGTIPGAGGAAEAVTNVVAAITADLNIVTAEDGAGNTVIVTANIPGIFGNSILFSEEDNTNMFMDGAGFLG